MTKRKPILKNRVEAAITVPINWQITWHNSHCDLPRNAAASPHRRQPAQGGGRAPLTVDPDLGWCT
jgi:hypothetical protein